MLRAMHHAYIYEGAQSELEGLVSHARELFQFTTLGDPDVRVVSIEKFGIDDSQKLKDQAHFKSVSGRALFIVGIASITSEAQQALLKLFEEPQTGFIFVLLTPPGTLLPTLRSRFVEYPEKLKFPGQKSSVAPRLFAQQISTFLQASQKERSTIITALLKDDDGVKERVRGFLDELEGALYKKIKDPKVREGLADIAKVRSYVGDRSPSFKMLLEHLSLSLPIL